MKILAVSLLLSLLSTEASSSSANPIAFDASDWVTLFVGLLGLVNVWGLFVVRKSNETVSALRAEDALMRDELNGIKLLVAQQYLTRNEFQTTMQQQTATITRSIERLEDKVDREVVGRNGNLT